MMASALSRAFPIACISPGYIQEVHSNHNSLGSPRSHSDPVLCVSPNSLSAPSVKSSQDQDGGGREAEGNKLNCICLPGFKRRKEAVKKLV